jgi:phosphoglycolate phosphatase-like HAD superfamily hydrolase
MDGTLTKPNLDFAEMYRRCNVDMGDDLLAAIAVMPPAEQAAAYAVIDEMEAEGRQTLQLMPGAIELAGWLKQHGIPTAIVTRNTAKTVDHLHKALWLPAGLQPFSPAISRDDAALPAKPNPAALQAIASEWDLPLSLDLVMVGDSPSNDIGFGKAADVSTVLLDTGRRCLEGGTDGGADIVVDALARLPHRLWQHFEIHSNAAAALSKYPAPKPTSAASVAASTGDAFTVDALSLAELDTPDADSGNTPLIWAADAGHVDVVRALLNRGASCNHKGFLGATAAARACRAGHLGVLTALLETPGCDPNIANDKMQAPLHFAAFKRKPEVVSALLAHDGCNPFVLDRKGRTPAEDTSDEDIRAKIIAAQEALIRFVPHGALHI